MGGGDTSATSIYISGCINEFLLTLLKFYVTIQCIYLYYDEKKFTVALLVISPKKTPEYN